MQNIRKKMTLGIAVLLAIPLFLGAKIFFVGAIKHLDQREKQITRPDARKEPFDLLNLEVAGQKVEVGRTFAKDSDWLEGLTIQYKNKTEKKIAYLNVELCFPDTRGPAGVVTYNLIYGTPFPAALKGIRSTTVEPNDAFSVKLTERDHLRLTNSLLGQSSVTELRRLEVRINFVLFDDGTAWDGDFLIPNPDKPGHFMRDPKRSEGKL